MPEPKLVPVRNKNTGGEWAVSELAVDAWREQGWEPIEEIADEAAAEQPQPELAEPGEEQ